MRRNNPAAPVAVELVATGRAWSPPPGRRVLAVVLYGKTRSPWRGAGLRVRIPLPALGAPRAEIWTCGEPPRRGRHGALRWAAADDHLFFALSAGQGRAPFEKVAGRAYRSLLAKLAALGAPHPLRVWQYLPAINREEAGLERYRRWCLGRHEALGALRPALLGAPPAASALGLPRGRRIHLYGVAGARAARTVENPRQLSAFRYPERYGPRPPSFSRGALAPGLAPPLQISGTASIRGHASRHAGDARAQLAETLRNLAAVARAGGARGLPALRALKVYLRDPRDRARLAGPLARALPGATVLWLRADICRAELALEIDAFAEREPAGRRPRQP